MLRASTSRATLLANCQRAASVFIPAKEFSPSRRSCSTSFDVEDETPVSRPPFRIHEDFAFHPEKDSLIKPIWRGEETDEELIWRAQLTLGLLETMKNRVFADYTVDILGVKGMEQRPVLIAEEIYRLVLKKDSLAGLTSFVQRPSPERLRILFASMDAKHEFLRAAPAINRIKNTFTDGETLHVFMPAYTKREVETGLVGLGIFNRSMFLDPEFEIKHKLITQLTVPDSAKAWIEFIETKMRSYGALATKATISFCVEGSIQPYERLDGKYCANIGKEILTSLSANSDAFKSFSYLSANNPFPIGNQDSEKSIFLEFQDIWPRNLVLGNVRRVRRIPDPLNPGQYLTVRGENWKFPLKHHRDVEEDNSLQGLSRRLNLVENTLRIASYHEHLKKYRIVLTSDSNLEGLKDPKNRDEEARRFLQQAFQLDSNFMNQLSLETFLASPNTGRTQCWLQIIIQKRWQAQYLRMKWHLTKAYKFGVDNSDSPIHSHAKMMANVVKTYLEKEKGVKSEVFLAKHHVPYVITADESGGRIAKFLNHFGLTKEDVNRYSPPGFQWGPKTAKTFD